MGGYLSVWNKDPEVVVDVTSVIIEPNELAMTRYEKGGVEESNGVIQREEEGCGTQAVGTEEAHSTTSVLNTKESHEIPSTSVLPEVSDALVVASDAEEDMVVRPDCIVALAGHLGSGKDTLATVLEQTIKMQPELKDVPVYRMAFADPIKDIICEQFNVSRSFLETAKRSKDPPEGFQRPVRDLLRHVGDFRTFKPDVWVDALLRKLPSSGIVIITDVRYPNELAALKQRNAYVVLLSRHLDMSKVDAHSSEQSLLPLYEQVHTKAFPTHLEHPLIDVYLKNDQPSTDTLHAVSRRIVQQMYATD